MPFPQPAGSYIIKYFAPRYYKILLVMLLVSMACSLHAQISFKRQQYAVGTAPQHVDAGDVNGDGHADLVVPNRGSNTVTVFIGDGMGEFAPAVHYPAGPQPLTAAIGDLNEDGYNDLVVSNFDTTISRFFTILLANPQGGFFPASRHAAYVWSTSVEVADFNKDGHLDLLAVGSASPTSQSYMSLYKGTGTGVFQSPTNYVTGVSPCDPAIADLDSDGDLDVVIANFRSNSIYAWLGTGTGTFAPPASYTSGAGYQPQSVVVDDINKDGRPDLLAGNIGSKSISVFLGTGAGAFGSPTAYPGDQRDTIKTVDIDNDGDKDVIAVSGFNLGIYLGNGTGSLTAPILPLPFTSSDYRGVTTEDLNEDGKSDIIFVDKQNNTVHVFLNGLHEELVPLGPPSVWPVGPQIKGITLGDLNHDGNLDLVAITPKQIFPEWWLCYVSVSLGNGDGSFADAVVYPVEEFPLSVALGDMNHDGNLDVVVGMERKGISILSGTGTGLLTPAVVHPAGNVMSLDLGDINGDGTMDIAAAIFSYPEPSILILLLDQNGTVASSAGIGLSPNVRPRSLVLGDVNKDGKQDMVIFDSSLSKISVYVGDGMGTFLPPVNYSATGRANVQLADVNNDGTLDIVAGGEGIYVNLGIGGGQFSPGGKEYNFGTFATGPIDLGDLNGDGNLDIFAANSNGSICLGNGKGAFGDVQRNLTTSVHEAVALGDINNDGNIDFAVASTTSETISVQLKRTIHRSAQFEQSESIAVGGGKQAVAHSDINNDGLSDVLAAGIDSGLSYALNAGGNTFSPAVVVPAGNQPSFALPVDIDVDGDQDIIVSHKSNNTISVKTQIVSTLGNLDFATSLTVPTVSSPNSISGADVDNDGDTDLIVTGSGTENMDVLLNLEKGTSFTRAFGSPYNVVNNPVSSVSADLDNDGDTDLALVNGDSHLVVMLNNGNGFYSLMSGSPFSVAAGPKSVVAGDFDKDGDLDLATANETSGNVSVMLRIGAGFSRNDYTIGTGAGPVDICSDDIDVDGDLDLIIANRVTQNISVLLNEDNGSFIMDAHYSAGAQPMAISMADTDNDGDLDISVANSGSDGSTLLVNAGGNFALSTVSTAQATIPPGGRDDMLAITARHRGRAGDTPVELSAFHLQFVDAMDTALSRKQVNNIIQQVEVWSDSNNDGVWQQNSDNLVTTATHLKVDSAGRTYVNLPDGLPDLQLIFEESRTFFIILLTQPDAASHTPSSLRVTHVTSASSRGQDSSLDWPVRLEYTPDVTSGYRAGIEDYELY